MFYSVVKHKRYRVVSSPHRMVQQVLFKLVMVTLTWPGHLNRTGVLKPKTVVLQHIFYMLSPYLTVPISLVITYQLFNMLSIRLELQCFIK